MSADLGTLQAKLQIDTSAIGLLQNKLKGLGDSFGPVGIAATAVGAVIVGLGGYAVELSSKYQTSLSQLQADMGITAKAAAAIGDAFLGTGGSVTFTAQEIVTAFAPVSTQLDLLNHKALDATQSLNFMKVAMALAEATGQPLNDVTAALVKTMVAYHLSLSDASTASDILYNSSKDLNQPIDAIATVVDKLAGRLGAATPPLAQVAALMIELSQNGVPARLAVSGATAAITALEIPSKAGAAAIAKLHLSTLDSTGSFIGMDSIISQLQPKFAKMTPAQQELTAAQLFGKPAAAAMVEIIDKGAKPFDALAKSVSAAGSAQKGANTATDNLGGSFDKLKTRITDMLTASGTPLQKFLKEAVDYINAHFVPAVQWITDHFNVLGPILAGVVVGLVALKLAMVALSVIEGVTTMVTMFRLGLAGATIAEAGAATGAYALGVAIDAMLGPIGLVAAALAGLIIGYEWLANHPLSAAAKAQSIATPGTTSISGAVRGVGHAAGGPVLGGVSYPVGELGPELFTPTVNGYITPHGQTPAGGGGNIFHIYVNHPAATAADISNALAWKMAHG
jgi:TP901 family phage tail tape measure protein